MTKSDRRWLIWGKKDKREGRGGKKLKELFKGTTEYEVKDRDNVYFCLELVCYVVSPRQRWIPF